MRDTEQLRTQLRALVACMPIAGGMAATAACEPEEQASPRAEASTNQVAPAKPEGTESPAQQKAPEPAKTKPPAEPPPLPGYQIGDPPLVEGYSTEEDTCVKGDWCGPLEAARAVASGRDATADDCPPRLLGAARDRPEVDRDAKVYAGLSPKTSMQGTLKEWRTARARESRNTEDLCCYHWFEYCAGRAWTDDGRAFTARLHPRAGAAGDWSAFELPPRAEGTSAPDSVARWLAAAWNDDAKQEHAAIASFSRAVIELMNIGAPAALVLSSLEAGADEVRHAQACLALAEFYGGEPVEPGPIPALAPREASLERLARDTFLEACVGETTATLRAQRQLRHCESKAAARVIELILTDETQHAALGWAVVRWALAMGGPTVRSALEAAVRSVDERVTSAASSDLGPASSDDVDPKEVARHGRLTAAGNRAVANDAWVEIIHPMAQELLVASARS